MNKSCVGIDDMALYAPAPSMDLQNLLDHRCESHPDMARKLRRAVENTGQVSFRFPEPWEDAASMAANAAAMLLDCRDASNIRYMASGTETAVDHAKPIASYVQGALESAGYPLGQSLTTFELKHACAGGTTALISTSALLGYSGRSEDEGLVICSDISRYDAPGTAEITHGAGAVAMIVRQNPDLLELDMGTHGYYASDVDDFFRPLDSITAKVKGRYSMECYQNALAGAVSDYCSRQNITNAELFNGVDYVVLHIPFVKMADTALRRFLKQCCGKNADQIEEYIERTQFIEAMELNRHLGNLYTGSLYAYMMCLLKKEYERLGSGIVGRKLLIASYGSGNTMIVFTGTVCEEAGQRISAWNLDDIIKNGRDANFSEYLAWLARPKDLDAWRNLLDQKPSVPGKFYLSGFGNTGLRLYKRS